MTGHKCEDKTNMSDNEVNVSPGGGEDHDSEAREEVEQ